MTTEISLKQTLKPQIKIEQSLKPVLAPELIQTLKVLQLNTNELDLLVNEQMLENPVLELDPYSAGPDIYEEFGNDSYDVQDVRTDHDEYGSFDDIYGAGDWGEYMSNVAYDDISYNTSGRLIKGQSSYAAGDDISSSFPEPAASMEQSLEEMLMMQLEFSDVPYIKKLTAVYIIQSLDENGYIESSDEELAQSLEVPVEEVKSAMELIRTFEPYGVGARDLGDCLKIQLKNKGLSSSLTDIIIDEYMDELAKNRLTFISKDTGFNIKAVTEAAELIRSLDPKPGRTFRSDDTVKYITPDATVSEENGELVVSINDKASPSLFINPVYRTMMMNSAKDSEEWRYLSDKMSSAMWLIKSIEQRRETIYNVTRAVVDHQSEFFEKGPKYLKPLTLRRIAEQVGVHESTVSRTVNGKYIQTPAGVFELRYFFGSGVSAGEDADIAATGIKKMIEDMISEEDDSSPLSDSAIAKKLTDSGIDISRRTVAKYRDEMNIPSSTGRRRFK